MNMLATTGRSAMSPYGAALRCAVAGFFVLTSLWALLAFVPFTYEQVHKGALLPPLNAFGRINHWLYWGALVLVAIAFAIEPLPWNPARAMKAKRLRAVFWAIHLPLATFLTARPVIAGLQNSMSSYIWAWAMLEPVLYMSALIWWERWPGLRWANKPSADDPRVFFAAWCSGVFLTKVYGMVAMWRGNDNFGLVDRVFGLFNSLITHLLVFLFLFLVLNFLQVISSWFRRPPLLQFLFCYAFGTVAFFLTVNSLVFSSISFSGREAGLYAFGLAVTVSLFLSSLSIGLRPPVAEPVQSGLALAIWVPNAEEPKPWTWTRIGVSAGVLAILAAVIAISSSRNDWNYLIQKLTALLVWITAFRLFYKVGLWKVGDGRRHVGRLLVVALALLPTYRLTEAAENYVWPRSGSPLAFARFLDVYSGYDPSFKLVHDALGSGTIDSGYYQFLSKNTNLPRTTEIKPVPVNLSENGAPPQAPAGEDRRALPHIFIITVDSLRRDYLSPYDSSIDFTPSIGKFASEAVVMRNAFTRYGGTGLSEPSIWTGSSMIHKQYVTPFSPMNSMQRVLDEHDYKMFVSRDSILQTVVTDSPKLAPLDNGVQTMSYDLCRTLAELDPKLEAASHGPVFAYTQPQNLHISAINREGGKAIDNKDYGRFYAPYASRLRRIDGCFGDFINKLKSRRLYDSSIVVLTADHGDSLGEEGRWGHAYTIYPEILRIPLIIHLPANMRDRYVTKDDALSFNSDLSATVHYLLGHRPIAKNEMFGRPLFTERLEEQNAYKREHYLVSSSYAAVHGILSGDGRFLYTSDAVNYRESWFDMTEAAPVAHRAPSSMRMEYQKIIRDKIGVVNRFYNFAGGDAASK